MRATFLYIFLVFCSTAIGQSLRDSLFSGKLKADTGKTAISHDTGKYIPSKIYSIPAQGDSKKNELVKLDESMPDSLNKSFYAKQKSWKRFIDINSGIISQLADDTRKVKKGTYSVEIKYEIGLNGKVKTTDIACNPPNEFILEQVTDLMKRTPTLSPPIYSDGKPRPLSATQTLTITKK